MAQAGELPVVARELSIMGIVNIVEEAAGAFAADKALEAIDPDAGVLAKTAAAIAGFEGVSKVQEMMSDDAAPDGQADDAAPQDDPNNG